jgi:hypothetical protein
MVLFVQSEGDGVGKLLVSLGCQTFFTLIQDEERQAIGSVRHDGQAFTLREWLESCKTASLISKSFLDFQADVKI